MDAGCWLLVLMSPLGRALLRRHGVMLGAWVPWVLWTLDAGNLQLAASFSWHQVITTEPQDFGWRTGLLHSVMVQPLLLLNWVRATPDRPFMSYKTSSQTRLIGHYSQTDCAARLTMC
jgi:hypothetical protein